MDILVIDDNKKLNETIKNFLELKDFNVSSAFNGKEALNIINNKSFDLYIIDIHLPNINGLDLITKIREKTPNIPIIMITSSDEINNFITAFENGCNEFIKKPFYLQELEIRLNNLLKNNKNIKKIDEHISFDFKNQDLLIDNKIVKTRKKEKRLLTILIKNLNDIVDTQDIINYVWENEEKRNYPLRQLISALKQKIPELKNNIQAVTGVGYRFSSTKE